MAHLPAHPSHDDKPLTSTPSVQALIRNPPLSEDDFVERFVPRPELKAITCMSTSLIYRKMKEGTFPRPVPLGGRRVAWLLSEVRQWMKERVEARDS